MFPSSSSSASPRRPISKRHSTSPAISKPWEAGRARGAALKRLDDGRYYAEIRLPDGAKLEYKITRGSWDSVEKAGDGGEIANRQLTVRPGLKEVIEVQAWADPSKQTPAKPAAAHSLTGDIRTHEKFKSRHLNNERTLIVYLPPDYKKDAERRFPVLYMHDGQNIFDAATSFIGIEWQADEIAERLIKAGRIEPIIIVGIYNNADRVDEYTPTRDQKRGGGKGEQYARFLVEEVKPFIDKEYRTKPDRKHTAVAGSSLGGLISLYICRQYPDTFSMCGVISPALMWDDGRILKDLRNKKRLAEGGAILGGHGHQGGQADRLLQQGRRRRPATSSTPSTRRV